MKDKNLQEQLVHLHLTQNEAFLYITLLKHKQASALELIKLTNLGNSQVYICLDVLLKRGLVSYTQKRGKIFIANSPEILVSEQQANVEKAKKLVPLLEQMELFREEDSSTQIQIFEGFDGFKSAFLKIISECKDGGEIKILGYSHEIFAQESLRVFLANMNLRTVEKKQRLKIILDETVRNTLGKDRESEPNTEVHYIPQKLVGPCAIRYVRGLCLFFLMGF
jgi:sugar-specific transcriptional regulator TrmB